MIVSLLAKTAPTHKKAVKIKNPQKTLPESTVRVAQTSHPGGRNENQDYIAVLSPHPHQPHLSGFVLCDGLSGEEGGAQAAQAAAQSVLYALTHHPDPHANDTTIRTCVKEAQRSLVEVQQRTGLINMRTTLVFLIVDSQSKQAAWAHMGDSRLYHFSEEGLRGRTRDHTLVQLELEAGRLNEGEARTDPRRSGIYRALGRHYSAHEIGDRAAGVLKSRDISCVRYTPGDSFLLCSDGLWEYLYDLDIEIDYLKSYTPTAWLRYLVTRRWRAVYNQQKMDSDNYSAVAVMTGA